MNDYILLMHNDGGETLAADWPKYFAKLNAEGSFQGGSAIGDGMCVSKHGEAPEITGHLGGYIRITAENLDHAKSLVAGNPVFEAGGTVEIRELPKT